MCVLKKRGGLTARRRPVYTKKGAQSLRGLYSLGLGAAFLSEDYATLSPLQRTGSPG